MWQNIEFLLIINKSFATYTLDVYKLGLEKHFYVLFDFKLSCEQRQHQ